ncbi:hypothetical protein SNE40_008480 [Patella caerulea]|uniref:Uncharacterized protein n=1 Tax=Patella caerulea TaxID=87958 RepID=A0AAN8K1A3_PATCE
MCIREKNALKTEQSHNKLQFQRDATIARLKQSIVNQQLTSKQELLQAKRREGYHKQKAFSEETEKETVRKAGVDRVTELYTKTRFVSMKRTLKTFKSSSTELKSDFIKKGKAHNFRMRTMV